MTSLHEEVGYVHKEKIPLKKNTKDGVTFHDVVGESESNVKYSCVRMLLRKEVFYETNSWIRSEV